jgi:murein DD-endopeptidase MepM/ murein hydrolase activator NlpD
MVFLLLSLVVLPASIQANNQGPGVRPVTANTPSGPLSHTVRQGDTLSAIAARYGVAFNDLVAVNHLANPDNLAEGQNLVIPVSAPVPGNPLAGPAQPLPWPVSGPVSSKFGEREIFGHQEFHAGIDIAGPLGTPIKAVLAGRVVFAATLGNYGQAVIIDHGDGFPLFTPTPASCWSARARRSRPDR